MATCVGNFCMGSIFSLVGVLIFSIFVGVLVAYLYRRYRRRPVRPNWDYAAEQGPPPGYPAPGYPGAPPPGYPAPPPGAYVPPPGYPVPPPPAYNGGQGPDKVVPQAYPGGTGKKQGYNSATRAVKSGSAKRSGKETGSRHTGHGKAGANKKGKAVGRKNAPTK